MSEKTKGSYDVIFLVTIAAYGLLVVAGIVTAVMQSGRPPSIDLNFTLRIEAMIERGEVDKVMTWIEQDVQVNFTDLNRPERYVFWGDQLDKHEHYEQAIQCYLRAIEFDVRYGPAYFSLGLTYGRLDDLNKAIDNLRLAYEIAPTNQDVRRALRDAQNAAARK